MQKKFPLISLYDAHSEKDIYGNPEVVSRSHALGHALAKASLGAIGRVGSSVVSTALTTLVSEGGTSIGLSPAANEHEHEKAYRLPHVAFPVIFTGRGALGTDLMALASGHAILIAGADHESLLGILGCIGDRGIPIGIFTEENPNEIRAMINTHYPNLILHVFVSKDADKVVYDVSAQMRKQHLENK